MTMIATHRRRRDTAGYPRHVHIGDGELTRIAPSTAFAAVPTEDLGQGDRINLGVAGIIGRLPAVAEALGSLTATLRANGTLSPRLLELVQAAHRVFQPMPKLHRGSLPKRHRRRS
jgi:hypothetical protein